MPITAVSLPSSLSRHLSSALSRLGNFSPLRRHHRHHPQTLSLLDSCHSTRDFEQVHSRVIRRCEDADPFIATRMLEFCASVSRDMSAAGRIFDGLGRHTNVYMWTAMIRGFANTRESRKAIEFYDRMMSSGVLPYKFTFISLLKACSAARDLRKGRSAHAGVVKVGLRTDAYLCSALVNLYGCCGDIRAAYRVFVESPNDNYVIWNAMIAAAFANGQVDVATKLFDAIPQRDLTTWNVAVNGFSKLGRMDHAKVLFEQMPCRNLVSWSLMIVGYAQNGRAVEALNVFEEMLVCGVRPDAVTMASALAACSQVGALDMGKWIHAYLEKNELECDVVLGTSLVDMYAKCGCIDLALQVFDGMQHKNVSSWNAMLCGLAIHGYGDDALVLFKEIELANIQPTDITFVGVLTACSHIGAVEEGRRLFDRMCVKYRIIPKVEHYGCMVDLLSRAGLIGEARDLILEMPMEPNLIILGSFLGACKIHGDLRTGELVVRHILGLNPGDVGCYVLLSNIFASRDEWDEVAEMRKLMKCTGVGKVPGCSSIEVDSVVHEFVVDDRSHPNWRDIFDVVDKMNANLEAEGFVPNSLLGCL